MKRDYKVPEGVDLTDPRARACWAMPTLTSERLDAWEQWKTDYVINCMERWMSQGASKEEALEAGALILAEYASLDDLPWMPLGLAKQTEISESILGATESAEVLTGDRRTAYMVATRTSVTSTEAERILNAAYQLGVSASHISQTFTQKPEEFSADEPNAGRTAVYRHFDADGMLLYIGVATNPGKRAEQHDYHSRWYRFVADTAVEWYRTRREAEEAERVAIKTERPVFNHMHNRSNRNAATDYLFNALSNAVDA